MHIVIIIVISIFVECHSKTKCRAPAYLRVLGRIKGDSSVSLTILGQTANGGLFTCESIKSWLCKHQIGNRYPVSTIQV